jgi:hypothetical protein
MMPPVFFIGLVPVIIWIFLLNALLYLYFHPFIAGKRGWVYDQIRGMIFTFFIVAGLAYMVLFRGLLGFLVYGHSGLASSVLGEICLDWINFLAGIFMLVLMAVYIRHISRKYRRDLGF